MRNKPDTLEKKLYQLIISRLDGDKIHSQEYQDMIFELISKGIGGFIIFGGKRDEVRPFIANMQYASEIPLFIASDIEQGVGRQIASTTMFPCQMAVRAAINRDRPEDIALLRDAIRAIASEAIDIGINMPLIPVLDVNQNPDNPIICTRAFSDNPEDVSWFGSEYIRVLEDSGLISCAKHFPGHGDTAIDSHISLPLICKSYAGLMSTDILPFKEAIRTGVSSIMAGHLNVTSLDSIPASLSKKVISGLLRKELGFGGLVITDALNMSALSGIDNVPARCIDAGVDILLHPADADLTVMELISAIRYKLLDERMIDAAIGRIIKAKAKIKHINRAEIDPHKHNILSRRITEMSITLVKYKPGILPVTLNPLSLRDRDKVSVGLLSGETFMPLRGTKEHENVIPTKVGIQNNGLVLDFCFRRNDVGEVLSGEISIFAIFSKTAAWRGFSGISEEEKTQISGLIRKAKKSIVISFGSPYILRHFKEADILIAAYDAGEQAQEAVVKCLKGERAFTGQMPVKVSLSF